MKRLALLSVLLLAPGVSGCGCTLELYIHFEPRTLTLTVGETTPLPRASQSGCAEPRHPVEIDTWTSVDPAVASVDADSGVVVGVAPGETEITASTLERDVDGGQSYLSYFGSVSVTVEASATTVR